MSTSIDQSSPATRVATPLPTEKPKKTEGAPVSPTTVVAELPPQDDVLASASTTRKLALMAMFSAAQFLDAFNNRYLLPLCLKPLSLTLHNIAVFPAIPDISQNLSYAPSETIWI